MVCECILRLPLPYLEFNVIITEVRIKLVAEGDAEHLRAFCSITIDGSFVVRDLKVLDANGHFFVAMPSRKMTDHCSRCSAKNCITAKFCGNCGLHLNPNRAPRDHVGRAKLYADIAHPITREAREALEKCVIDAYTEELELSKKEGYHCRYEEYE